MDTFVAGVSAALGGAIGGLIGFVLALTLGWWRRPRIAVDLEEYKGRKPFAHEYTVFPDTMVSVVPQKRRRGALIRLNVWNKGRSTAMNCEAKVEVCEKREDKPERQPWVGMLRWSRHASLVYRRDATVNGDGDQQFTPINLNSGSTPEMLELLCLGYEQRMAEAKEISIEALEICTQDRYPLKSDHEYQLEVVVSASNTEAKKIRLNVNWNGRLVHFLKGECVTIAPKPWSV